MVVPVFSVIDDNVAGGRAEVVWLTVAGVVECEGVTEGGTPELCAVGTLLLGAVVLSRVVCGVLVLVDLLVGTPVLVSGTDVERV